MLANLLADMSILKVTGDPTVGVSGLTADSRAVQPGDVFVARPGQRQDGRRFIPNAIQAGAVAVVCEPPVPDNVAVPVVLVPNAHRALAELAAALYGHPSRKMGLIGVTGTDGKTTTTHLIAAILNAAGIRAGLMSTVALNLGDASGPNRTSQTTPEAPIIQRSLAHMRNVGVKVAVLEISSHALDLERVHGCVFDCAVFTNLDPEHLDFHGTLANYRAAKAKLFAQLDSGPGKPWGRLAVVNHDDPNGAFMRGACTVPAVDYGLSREATIRASIIRSTIAGTTFRVDAPDDSTTIRTGLLGRYNVTNWLGAIAAARHFGATLRDARQAAADFPGVPGRLERLECGQKFTIFIDFAHTPQGLAASLGEVRKHVSGRLITLFGQAGHRDLQNRSRMARAVAENADLAVVTSDDPYDEDPQRIVDDLGHTLQELGWRENREFWRIVDRRDAIAFAIDQADPCDCVFLAGRGPETETTIQGRVIELNDAEVARAALGRRSAA